MSTPNPAGNDRRRRTRQSKLGPSAACAICGLSNTEALLLHRHHVGLEGNDPVVVCVLCLNHHAIAQERLRQIGLCEWEELAGSPIERQLAARRGRVDFWRLLADQEERDVELMERFLAWLDNQGVDWRLWSS
ncbi:MAG TPA: hypothetical protein VGP46_01870 [Acidimicrobiales bacterium]|nr:hypothetical protein [Acidimicrobiales bacterium]